MLAKHRKLVYLSLVSAGLLLFGMAAGSWAVDKLKGDKAVINDIDRHFEAIARQEPPVPQSSKSVPAAVRNEPDDKIASPRKPQKSVKKTSEKKKRANKRTKKKQSSKDASTNASAQPASFPGVTKLAPSTYLIDKQLIDEARTAPKPFIKGVRAVLTQKNGAPVGFRLLGIRPQSALSAVGLRNKDILTAVNGHKLDSIDNALSAAGALQIADRFRVDLIRGGREISLYYRVAKDN